MIKICAFMLFSFFAFCTLCAADTPPDAVHVAPADPNIHYVGRWDKSDPTTYHSYWGGAYLRTGFTGTSIGVQLATGQSVVAIVDNGEPRAMSVPPAGMMLFSKLKAGPHSLLLAAPGQNYELPFQGLTLDAGATTMPVPARPIIEFVGDSITTGTGLSDASTVNWAWNTAEALGCDHAQIAFSARALTTGFGCGGDTTGLDVQYFRLKNFNHLGDNPPVPWNFSYTPQIIVINLGQNDQCGSEPAKTMTTSYINFVHGLRAKFPKAQLAALRPFGGPYEAAIRAAIASLNAAGDARVHYIDTTGWLDKSDYVDGVHPNAVGNLKIMGELTPALRPLLNLK